MSKITVTELSADVELQALLNRTTERILLTQENAIKSLPQDIKLNLTLICKWGCNGTSGFNTFKQKFIEDDGSKTDEYMFVTSLVPLQLVSSDEDKENSSIFWKNPRPSSPRFCRPIRVELLHESDETTRKRVDDIKNQEKHLQTFHMIIDGRKIDVVFKLALTMIDGKVCNALTDTSSAQRCYLCQSTISQFNKIDEILGKQVSEENLVFGISSLHAWIRFFECLLHISYKLEVKTWIARKDIAKIIEKRKKEIQKNFRLQLGLLVDIPKQGYGSSNDGNTARCFFRIPEFLHLSLESMKNLFIDFTQFCKPFHAA